VATATVHPRAGRQLGAERLSSIERRDDGCGWPFLWDGPFELLGTWNGRMVWPLGAKMRRTAMQLRREEGGKAAWALSPCAPPGPCGTCAIIPHVRFVWAFLGAAKDTATAGVASLSEAGPVPHCLGA